MEGKAAASEREFFKAVFISDADSVMEGVAKGPATSDEAFFNALSDNLEDVKAAASRADWQGARKLFASCIRSQLDRERFFTIPYEIPENIFKLPGESDSEAVKRIEDFKVVSVGVMGDFSAQGRIGWKSNPTYNAYKEWTWQLSRHNEIKMMAHEYNLTGDERIAHSALGIMRSWIEDAVMPPLGTSGYATKCWRTIECGIRMGANWPYILFSFIKSPAFTDELVVDWFKSVYEHALRLTSDRTRANWLVMEMNGLAHIGILFPFFKDASAWLDDAVATLDAELDKQLYPDGFQYELTTNYHDVVVNNYQRLFETAKAFGYSLPESMRLKLVKATKLYVELMMGDGTTPDINDGRRAPARDFLLPKARFFHDESMDFVLNGGPEPSFRSVTLPWSGFAVFRSGWRKEDCWALFDSAPFGRAHQHEDKLNFLLFANGKYLVTEGGNYAYDDSPMRRYILSTASHNTALVDGKGQDRKSHYEWHDEDIALKADLRSNIPSEFIEWAEGSYSEGYEDVSDKTIVHKRRVIFLREEHVFVLVDDFSADEEHSWDILFHIDDERRGATSWKSLNVLCPSEGVETKIITGQTEPFIQGYVALGQAQGDYKSVDCLILSTEGKEKRVVTVLDCLDGSPTVSGARLDGGRLILSMADGEKEVPLA